MFNGSTKLVWWILGSLFAVIMLGVGTGGKIVYDSILSKIDGVDRRMFEMEKVAMVRVPEHAMFAAQIAAADQRIEVMESSRDNFMLDVKQLTVELNAIRVQMASLSTALASAQIIRNP